MIFSRRRIAVCYRLKTPGTLYYRQIQRSCFFGILRNPGGAPFKRRPAADNMKRISAASEERPDWARFTAGQSKGRGEQLVTAGFHISKLESLYDDTACTEQPMVKRKTLSTRVIDTQTISAYEQQPGRDQYFCGFIGHQQIVRSICVVRRWSGMRGFQQKPLSSLVTSCCGHFKEFFRFVRQINDFTRTDEYLWLDLIDGLATIDKMERCVHVSAAV